VVHAHADPALVPAQVVDPLGDRLAQDLVLEVLGPDLLRMAPPMPLPPGIAEIPDQLLLLGIDRDDRLALRLEGAHLAGDILELGVTIRVVAALLGLAVGLEAVAPVGEQGGDGLVADGMTHGGELLGQSPRALGGPAQGRLRVASGGRLDEGQHGGPEGRVVVLDEVATAPRGPDALGR